MNISVSDPMGWAGTRTGRMLFKPFKFGTWFVLGFAAFLSQLGEGGGAQLRNIPTPGGGGAPRAPGRGGAGNAPVDPVTDFLAEMGQLFSQYAHWIIPLVFLGLLLGVIVFWLRARGKFIFLDGVARNYAAIVEPWTRLAPQANSYFLFDITVAGSMLLAMFSVAVIGFLIALPDLRAGTMTAMGIAAISVGAVLLLALTITYTLITAVAENFLIPLMYLRAQRIRPAWAEFRTRVLPGHIGIIFAYFLLRGVLNVAAATFMIFGTCLTCFIALIPYLGTVLFLPIFVFMRAYSLYFLEQFGPEYRIMSDIASPPMMAFPVIFNPPPPVPTAPAMEPPPIPPQGDQPQ